MKHIVLDDGKERSLVFYLAMEEYLARYTEDEAFFVWQVPPTVIIGRNQVMAAEVNLPYCRANGIRVFRRKSGGGCVYSDRGNLMVSCVMSGKDVPFLFENYIRRLALCLRRAGLEAEVSGRNDILVSGKKVSGNAFFSIHGRNVMHGTLLFDCNLEQLENALTPSGTKLQSKGVSSVRQRVGCLRQFLAAPSQASQHVSGQESQHVSGQETRQAFSQGARPAFSQETQRASSSRMSYASCSGPQCDSCSGLQCTSHNGLQCASHNGLQCTSHNGLQCASHNGLQCASHSESQCASHSESQCASHSESQCASCSGPQCTSHNGLQCASCSGPQCTSHNGLQCVSHNGLQCTSRSESQCASCSGPQCTSHNGLQCTSRSESQCASHSESQCASGTGEQYADDMAAFSRFVVDCFCDSERTLGENEIRKIEEIEKTYLDPVFLYGHEPAFSVSSDIRLPLSGTVTISLDIRRSRIAGCSLSGDYLHIEDGLQEELSRRLASLPRFPHGEPSLPERLSLSEGSSLTEGSSLSEGTSVHKVSSVHEILSLHKVPLTHKISTQNLEDIGTVLPAEVRSSFTAEDIMTVLSGLHPERYIRGMDCKKLATCIAEMLSGIF